jgi:voltage-gated potassium channel
VQALRASQRKITVFLIAVPTGIVSAEFAQMARNTGPVSTHACSSCACEGHDVDAVFCKQCGEKLGDQN